MPHILIITPSDIIATAFQTILTAQDIPTSCINNVSDNYAGHHAPNLIFLDDAIIAADTRLERIQKKYPNSKIVIMSIACEPAQIWKMMEAGVRGYLCLHDRLVSRLPLILEDVLNGGLYLSPTAQAALTSIRYYRSQDLTDYQANVLRLMAKHWTANRIASELGRSTAAIYQVQKLLRETFDAETNSELVEKVMSLKLLDVTTP
jgi:DNA-binding NarL/FixJ family response regulator